MSFRGLDSSVRCPEPEFIVAPCVAHDDSAG